MKKNLLALAAGLLLTSMPLMATTWGVIGGFNYWAGDVEMTEVSEGVFTVTMEELNGEFKFRADHDWNVNLGAYAVSNITGNGVVGVVSDGRNFIIENATNVTFSLDTNINKLTISGMPNDMEVSEVMEMYVIGDPAGGWNPTAGVLMTYDEGKYRLSRNFESNNYFSIVNQLGASEGDWETLNAHRYGPVADGTLLNLEGVNEVAYPVESAWCAGFDGFATLVFDPEAMTLTLENVTVSEPFEIKSIGLIGEFNDWAGDVEMEKVSEGVYTVTVDNFGGTFKFRANGEWGHNWGAEKDAYISGDCEVAVAENGSNFNIASVFDRVTFMLDLNAMRLKIELGSGVDGIGVEETEAVYYTLGGVRVANPEEGIYIRVRGGEAVKVNLRK